MTESHSLLSPVDATATAAGRRCKSCCRGKETSFQPLRTCPNHRPAFSPHSMFSVQIPNLRPELSPKSDQHHQHCRCCDASGGKGTASKDHIKFWNPSGDMLQLLAFRIPLQSISLSFYCSLYMNRPFKGTAALVETLLWDRQYRTCRDGVSVATTSDYPLISTGSGP